VIAPPPQMTSRRPSDRSSSLFDIRASLRALPRRKARLISLYGEAPSRPDSRAISTSIAQLRSLTASL
jgi:hypothetical protein